MNTVFLQLFILLISSSVYAGPSGLDDNRGFEQVACTGDSSDISVLTKHGKPYTSFPKARNGSIVKPYQDASIKIGSNTYLKVQFSNSKTGYINKRFIVLTKNCKSTINKAVQVCKSTGRGGNVNVKDQDFKNAGSVKSYTPATRTSFKIVKHSNKDYVPVKFSRKGKTYWINNSDISYGRNSCPKQGAATTSGGRNTTGPHIFPLYEHPHGNYHSPRIAGQKNPRCYDASRKRGRKHAAVDLYNYVYTAANKRKYRRNKKGKKFRSIGAGVVVRAPVLFYMGTYEFAIKDNRTKQIFRYGEIFSSAKLKKDARFGKGVPLGITKWTGLKKYPPMLHLEIYNGKTTSTQGVLGAGEKGYAPKRSRHQRHQDLINPTSFVRKLEKRTFGKNAF